VMPTASFSKKGLTFCYYGNRGQNKFQLLSLAAHLVEYKN